MWQFLLGAAVAIAAVRARQPANIVVVAPPPQPVPQATRRPLRSPISQWVSTGTMCGMAVALAVSTQSDSVTLVASMLLVLSPVVAVATVAWALQARPAPPRIFWVALAIPVATVSFALAFNASAQICAVTRGGCGVPPGVAESYYDSLQVMTTTTIGFQPQSLADKWIAFWEMLTTAGLFAFALPAYFARR